ncbi:hypothetical protein A2763_03300 [Candidatus Kaiserbacteria bacterium RIFCSPHIGHO2_01_FULL_54_36]|uniref:Uncharacterized protein n=1 Tax=Candidatus Kaiserbacteria bacterium RIFCSPHIGHO2_01_FULL_54_36 TaxID=1798482 RepID=A0A1F6CL27_9BACT|nr:MAG: hypothetical protein A2763_03300 [Candidatus Kaiserbacteria bacterium RIFCSPHIGHO2_01_FULL_54_36]OGG75425.1 MAG: hypothetical protein A3A41_02555 [Candidatus Kaiserbacteria bacterium RIFCSPLOWO2_01_FULL_54_22]
MRTALHIAVPWLLLVGFIVIVYGLYGFSPEAPPCAIGACPRVLHETDARKTFAYHEGVQFSIVMTESNNPSRSLRCIPEGVIARMEDAAASDSTYTAVFQGVAHGTCALTGDNFSATILIQ